MPKAPTEPDQIDRIRHACLALDELQEETLRLCESITAEARRARAQAIEAREKVKVFRGRR